MTTHVITGVNGYIGSNIAKKLLAEGHKVAGIDIIKKKSMDIKATGNYDFAELDITNISRFPSYLKKAEVLIHCAALVHKKIPATSENEYFRINVDGTHNILEFLRGSDLRHIVFFSTVSVYSSPDRYVIPDEKTLPEPQNAYEKSKLAAEEAIISFSKETGIPYTILRLAPVYGRGFFLNLHKRIYLPGKKAFYKINSGKQRISLCSINNIMELISLMICNPLYYNGTYIVKDPEDYSVNQIIALFRKLNKWNRLKPTVIIPSFIPQTIFYSISQIFPEKGRFLRRSFEKVSKNSLYSGQKLLSSGIPLSWNLSKTLFDNVL